ncbi:DUF6082 family protein [Paractinoplanes brasiliensis]|uniref:Uncharacterized protein n=1 Tax=Paractinoplanes brasiliensis TaxID=52695 RepID=A0A4V3C8Q3_9ACTN|nr:DUF6082 family protein [Actinoplanes brasiliensis]TDO42348.1 hypothetical protein C8E87_6118 [Actinoplanes brasiliensis]
MTDSRSRRRPVPPWSASWLAIGALCALFLGAIVAFPIATQGVFGSDHDWKALSDVGQAYGGVSAIVAGLGFCGIAASLALQAKQTRLAQAISARERHFELVKLGLEYPGLSYQIHDDPPELYKKKVIINLWVAHWLLLWDIGDADESFLRSAFTELFHDEVAREWWLERGSTWGARDTRRHQRFMHIAWDCHESASPAPGEASETN